MNHLRIRGAKLRAKLPRTRSAALLTTALLAGAVLGPLAGMAIGSAGTTTVLTTTTPCVTTVKTVTVPVVTTIAQTITTSTQTTTTSTTTTTTTTTGTGTTTTGTTTTGTTPTTTTTYTTTTVSACNCPPPSKTLSTTTPATTTQATTTATTTTTAVTTGATTTATTTTGTNGTGGTGIGSTTTITTTPTTTTPQTSCYTTTKVKVPPYVAPTNTSAAPAVIKVPKKNPFATHAMWIWELAATDHGNLSQIIATAKADGIGTLMIKSGDGRTPWSQFNRTLVREIHAAHLKVCAWQYVYGNYAAAEAAVGALAKRDGADCLVIDAEVQYQGRYVAAQTYVRDLRRLIGKNYPVGLAGLPYIQYHTNFPYSIFLGPGGTQYNVPQMYWIDIGTTVPYVFATTYEFNEIYQRPIFPLGQLYADSEGSPNSLSIGQFNTIAKDYRATGVSWWDFQSATPAWLLDTDRSSAAPAGFVPLTSAVTLVKNDLGDMVVWAQERLDGAGANLTVDGDFGAATQTAVESFQAKHRLAVTGKLDGRTWDALLKYRATGVTWSARGNLVYATVTRGGHRLTSVVALGRRAVVAARRSELRQG